MVDNDQVTKTRVLTVRDVEKIYGGMKDSSSTKALAGVSMDIFQGDYIAIMGPSGSGKSTLLNCIATIDRPTSGSIIIGDTDVSSMKSRDLARFRREQLGFIFQDANLLDTLTCHENIALPLTIAGVKVQTIEEKVLALSSLLNITEILEKYPYQVSGGQKQRVAAARAMISDPTLVLADEPTGSLDSGNAKIVLECFDDLNTRLGATIMLVTHDSFAASYCRRVLFIRDGKLYTELVRGNQKRRQFFDQIIQVIATIGGEETDVL